MWPCAAPLPTSPTTRALRTRYRRSLPRPPRRRRARRRFVTNRQRRRRRTVARRQKVRGGVARVKSARRTPKVRRATFVWRTARRRASCAVCVPRARVSPTCRAYDRRRSGRGGRGEAFATTPSMRGGRGGHDAACASNTTTASWMCARVGVAGRRVGRPGGRFGPGYSSLGTVRRCSKHYEDALCRDADLAMMRRIGASRNHARRAEQYCERV